MITFNPDLLPRLNTTDVAAVFKGHGFETFNLGDVCLMPAWAHPFDYRDYVEPVLLFGRATTDDNHEICFLGVCLNSEHEMQLVSCKVRSKFHYETYGRPHIALAYTHKGPHPSEFSEILADELQPMVETYLLPQVERKVTPTGWDKV